MCKLVTKALEGENFAFMFLEFSDDRNDTVKENIKHFFFFFKKFNLHF